MVYRDYYLNPTKVFANSERVLKFNIELFNKWIVRVGNWEDEAPDMAIMTMRECLDSMRRLGTKHLYDIVSTLIGFRIEQLEARLVWQEARHGQGLAEANDYLFKTAAERGIKILKVYQEMFNKLKA
jgi:hypothetical protein